MGSLGGVLDNLSNSFGFKFSLLIWVILYHLINFCVWFHGFWLDSFGVKGILSGFMGRFVLGFIYKSSLIGIFRTCLLFVFCDCENASRLCLVFMLDVKYKKTN